LLTGCGHQRTFNETRIGGRNRRITHTLIASRLVYSVIDPHIEPDTVRQGSLQHLQLLLFLFLLYILCYLDRSNVSIAALQMNKALKFGSATFGFGAGIFFLGYALFEGPSNLILARVGADGSYASHRYTLHNQPRVA
jgi:hypothetical protein